MALSKSVVMQDLHARLESNSASVKYTEEEVKDLIDHLGYEELKKVAFEIREANSHLLCALALLEEIDF